MILKCNLLYCECVELFTYLKSIPISFLLYTTQTSQKKYFPVRSSTFTTYYYCLFKVNQKLELSSIKPPGAEKQCFSKMVAKRLKRQCQFSIGFEPVHPSTLCENSVKIHQVIISRRLIGPGREIIKCLMSVRA